MGKTGQPSFIALSREWQRQCSEESQICYRIFTRLYYCILLYQKNLGMTFNLSITVYSPVSNISCENISEWRFRNQRKRAMPRSCAAATLANIATLLDWCCCIGCPSAAWSAARRQVSSFTGIPIIFKNIKDTNYCSINMYKYYKRSWSSHSVFLIIALSRSVLPSVVMQILDSCWHYSRGSLGPRRGVVKGTL